MSERSESQPVVVHEIHVRIHPSLEVFRKCHTAQRLIKVGRLLHGVYCKRLICITGSQMLVISTQSSRDEVFGEVVKGMAQLLEALKRLTLISVVEPFNRRHEIIKEFQIVDVQVCDNIAKEYDEGCEWT
jgi:hypothetical protein